MTNNSTADNDSITNYNVSTLLSSEDDGDDTTTSNISEYTINSTFLSLQLKNAQQKLQNYNTLHNNQREDATFAVLTTKPSSDSTIEINVRKSMTTISEITNMTSSLLYDDATTSLVLSPTKSQKQQQQQQPPQQQPPSSQLESRLECLSHIYDFTRIDDNYRHRSQRRSTIKIDNKSHNKPHAITTITEDDIVRDFDPDDDDDVSDDDDELKLIQSLADCLTRLHSIDPLRDDDARNLRRAATRRFYDSYHAPDVAKTKETLRNALRRPRRRLYYYPSEEACATLRRDEEFRGVVHRLWTLRCVVEGIPDVGSGDAGRQRDWVLDELCRPVVHRVMYHFVTNHDDTEERTTTTATTNDPSVTNDVTTLLLQTSQRQELALNYLMDTAMTGPLRLILSLYSQQPFHHTPTSCRSKHLIRSPSNAGRYFLRDMVLLGQHVLRSMPHGTHLLRLDTLIRHVDLFRIVVERLLRFDAFVERLWQREVRQQRRRRWGGGDDDGRIVIPRLIHEFVTRHARLYDRWMMMELKSAKRLLLSSGVNDDDGDNDEREQRIFCRESELFVSLLRSLAAKRALVISSSSSSDRLSSDVVAPLSTIMLERYHTRAATALTTSRAATTTEKLVTIMWEWCDIITGANIASHALLSEGGESGEGGEIWQRAGRSMERLRDAMVEDAVGVMLEDVLMKRGKMAGYIMTLPHVLFSYEGDGDEEDKEEEGPSETLKESFELLEIMVDACEREQSRIESAAVETAAKIANDMDESKESPLWEMGTFGPRVIMTQLSQAVSAKLTEVVQSCYLDHDELNPHDTISVDGARRLHRDVRLIAKLFPESHDFGRLVDISRLASWNDADFTSLKNVLRCLLMGDGVIKTSSENEEVNAVNRYLLMSVLEEVDERVKCEAASMLLAKGFKFVSMEDAWILLNRERVGGGEEMTA